MAPQVDGPLPTWTSLATYCQISVYILHAEGFGMGAEVPTGPFMISRP